MFQTISVIIKIINAKPHDFTIRHCDFYSDSPFFIYVYAHQFRALVIYSTKVRKKI